MIKYLVVRTLVVVGIILGLMIFFLLGGFLDLYVISGVHY